MNANTSSPLTLAKALADPTREQIMNLTCCSWLSVNEIVEQVGVSQPTVSHHLAVLKEANLVKSKSEGKHTYYILNQDEVASCCGMIINTFAPETDMAIKVNQP